jgi:hypothetical protein
MPMYSQTTSIEVFDPELARAIANEVQRQEDHVELIASENYASPRVMAAQGSVLTNKYAEGYPASAITAAANSSTSPRTWPIERASSCSAPTTPTCSRIRVRRPMPRSISRC